MEIKVLFFGEIQQCTKQSEMLFRDVFSSNQLNEKLQLLYPDLKSKSYRIAVNKTLVDIDTELKDGDTVAFLPPFAGG
ncbi:MAG: MoaD/ThiS family protein [Bacteroidota bacterium]